MLKITCNNPVCGSLFNFNEERNPTAKKVMCPKCKNVQTLQESRVQQKEDDFDWLKSDDGPNVSAAPVIRQVFTNEPQRQSNEFEDFAPPKTTKDAPVTPQRKTPKALGMREDEIGWLIIHDENTDTYTFDLRKGINRIGRHSDSTDEDVNIRIRTQDRYMSRHHCDIEVRWKSGKNVYEYVLSDRAYQRKKASSNGTFVNAGRQLSVRDEIFLKDGDTVQVGRTKLVLKLPSAVGNLQEAESWVRETDYFKTIIQ